MFIYLVEHPEWISGGSSNTMSYGTSQSAGVVYHHASRLTPQNFTEIKGTAEDATVYLGMLYVSVIRSNDHCSSNPHPG
jgi:hypothetical protein